MGLVDLRGRGDDAEVRALGARLLSEAGATGAEELPRLLVGWSEDGALVGCIGIERAGDREFA